MAETKVKADKKNTAKKTAKKRITKKEKQKQEQALEIVKRLKEAYPDEDCTLEYDQAWKLLVSVR